MGKSNETTFATLLKAWLLGPNPRRVLIQRPTLPSELINLMRQTSRSDESGAEYLRHLHDHPQMSDHELSDLIIDLEQRADKADRLNVSMASLRN